MAAEDVFSGSLFSTDFLEDAVTRLPDWQQVTDDDVEAFESDLRAIFDAFPIDQTPNESQTEDDLIWKVLLRLGWSSSLRQQNLTVKGRDDVPDGLFFADDAAKERANTFPEEWKRYEFGLAIIESKRWSRPLDRRSGRRTEETAPSTQMLRYLRRVDDLTTGALRWGMLTNGSKWRLYYQGARSVSEQFFELDLATILNLPGHNDGLFALDDVQRRHWQKVFLLIFRREAFLPSTTDERTFHLRALDEGRFYEEHIAANLSKLVFENVFPELIRSIAAADPGADLESVRNAALTLLYRLLFILYAEDRNLLPVKDDRYDDYGLRDRVRGDVGRRKDINDTFSETAARYWATIQDLSRAIDAGDASIGLPPYNGGLFDEDKNPLLSRIRIGDAVMADVIDALSFIQTPEGRKYINYRDLSVQQLGSIYERLLEYEVVLEDGTLTVQPNIFARKGSGSYYTPDDLVALIIKETVGPLVATHLTVFEDKAEELASSNQAEDRRLGQLKRLDPAERMLELKVCDPAMGSGHFLVSLVDYLADQVIAAMAEAEALVDWGDYISPLSERIDTIRNTILGNAEDRGWTIDEDQLDDRHIIRRIILKRCVYGVDKNSMAVELAKVALWLHTFTVGAPLSFLDHHLRSGDSLFGSWVRAGIDKASKYGAELLLHEPRQRALRAASGMQVIEGLTDAEITEAHRSSDLFDEIVEMTSPLRSLLDLIHAIDWLNIKDGNQKISIKSFFDGEFGDPIAISSGNLAPKRPARKDKKDLMTGQIAAEEKFGLFTEILDKCLELINEERFLHWQVVFPGVWSEWESNKLNGGFDAVIGNPPWDRMKLQQVEWFAARKRDIALAQRASDRRRMITALEKAEDPLAKDFAKASERAEASVRVARSCGDYPLLSGGDLNLYSLFVERAMTIVKPEGMIGLLTPSGIASDKTSSEFFKGVATDGRLTALYDFENRRTRYGLQPFFPDVDSRFKFCAFVASPSPTLKEAQCAFFLQDVRELKNPEACFTLSAKDFAAVNPNTGTAPIFRSRRDAELTTDIYRRLPVLIDRSSGKAVKTWPVRYSTMFHMTNDSGLFRTKEELENQEGAYPTGNNRFRNESGDWLPLYEGKMVQAFDHRAANIVMNFSNQHRPAQPEPATIQQHEDPEWLPNPQYWVHADECGWNEDVGWVVGFKEITAPTNVRTFIAAIFPAVGFGNKVPIFLPDNGVREEWLLVANFNAIVFDYVTRQKIQGQTLNLFIVEQLPVIPAQTYEETVIGNVTAKDIAKKLVLELTYASFDLSAFARDLGYVDDEGNVLSPLVWNEEERLIRRAKLDALFFILYGIRDRETISYIYSSFPIMKRQEEESYGRFASCELCLMYLNALLAGDPNAEFTL